MHAIAVTLVLFAGTTQFTDTDTRRLTAELRAEIGEDKTMGLVAGVRRGDDVWVAGFGRIRADGEQTPDQDTLFEIGSISKVFVGLLLADFVDRGLVELDDPVQSLLPQSVTMPRKGAPIRLVDLSTHRSGLPRMPSNSRPADRADPFADYTTEKLYAFLARHELRREPGEYEYSNLAVGLLGHVLARKAGQRFDELMTERVLKPLGLDDTAVQITGAELPNRARVAAVHRRDGGRAKHWYFDSLAGAGALRSSVRDLMRFIGARFGAIELDDGERWRRLFELAEKPHATSGGPPVGLGWHYRGEGWAWHNGGTGGSASFLAIHPESERGFVLLSNTNRRLDDAARKLFAWLERAK